MTTRPPKLAVVATALALSASVAGSAAARGPAPGDAGGEDREAQRTELYREAVKAASAGHWLESRERLRAVLAIRSSPKVLFSLAQAEEQLGQLASAQADYARALQGAALEGKGDVVRAAELAERALAPRVPHLRIVLAGGEHGDGPASATLDDQPVALAATVAVDLGDHRVVVNAPGMRTATAIVKLGEGQQLELPVALEVEHPAPARAAAVPPALAPAPTRPLAPQGRDPRPSWREPVAAPEAPRAAASPLRTAGLVTAGLGVLALGAGAVFGVASIAKHDDAERACPGAACADASGVSLWHDAVTFGDVSTAALVLGGVGVVVGAVLWLAAPTSSGGSTQVGLGPGSFQLRDVW